MDTPAAISGQGRLIPLRTKAEVEASFETVEVYITQIKPRFANASISYVVVNFCAVF